MARLDAVVGQSLTIAACPQQQSRHFSLIARIGFNAITWSGGQFGFIAEKQLHWLIALGAEAWSPTAEAHSLTEAHSAGPRAPWPRIGQSRGFGPPRTRASAAWRLPNGMKLKNKKRRRTSAGATIRHFSR